MKRLFTLLTALLFMLCLSGCEIDPGSVIPGSVPVTQQKGGADGSTLKCVKFGKYPEKKDIEWIVLDEKDGEVLLLSRYSLCCMSYRYDNEKTTWETSDLREWMNGIFYDEAFSKSEKKKIRTVTNENDDSPGGTPGGNETEDKVFALSLTEVYKYFGKKDPNTGETLTDPETGDVIVDAQALKTTCLEEVRPQYFYEGDTVPSAVEDPDFFFLRTPGAYERAVYVVWPDGSLTGSNGVITEHGARPAIWVKADGLKVYFETLQRGDGEAENDSDSDEDEDWSEDDEDEWEDDEDEWDEDDEFRDSLQTYLMQSVTYDDGTYGASGSCEAVHVYFDDENGVMNIYEYGLFEEPDMILPWDPEIQAPIGKVNKDGYHIRANLQAVADYSYAGPVEQLDYGLKGYYRFDPLLLTDRGEWKYDPDFEGYQWVDVRDFEDNKDGHLDEKFDPDNADRQDIWVVNSTWETTLWDWAIYMEGCSRVSDLLMEDAKKYADENGYSMEGLKPHHARMKGR